VNLLIKSYRAQDSKLKSIRFSKKQSKKVIIEFKRKWLVLYKRIILFIKVNIILFISLLIFTDYLNLYVQKLRHELHLVTTKHGLTLENIIIEGKIHTSYHDILQAINTNKGAAILSINLEQIKNCLEQNIWVKQAIVERRLPSTICVSLIEKKPIAIWQFKGKLYLIDATGNCITKYNHAIDIDLSLLLHVVGCDANIYANALLSDIKTHPNLMSRIKSAVRYGNRRWNLYMDQDLIVKMPEQNFKLAYQYLYLLNSANKLFNQGYKILDLRDPNKFYLERH